MIEFDAEKHAAEEGLLIHERPELGAITVTGADRLTWLNGLVTCELAKLVPGEGAYGLSVGKTGKILAEIWVVVAADRLVVATAKDRLGKFVEHLDRHLVMEDVELADASAEIAWIFAEGPRANEGLAIATSKNAPAARIDWTGRGDAIVIAASASEGAELLSELSSLPFSARAREGAFETLQLLWGLPRFGVDFGEDNVPHEASLDKLAVSFTKGCYLGQEAVFMLDARGHAKKHLALIHVTGVAPVARGAEVKVPAGETVGEVTSSVVTGADVVLLAFVKHKHATPGAVLEIDGRPAHLVDLAARPIAPQR